MAFLPNIERYFNSNATLDGALKSELQHVEKVKNLSEGQLSEEVNNKLLSVYKKIFQNQKTLMVPEDTRFTQHYINMSQYFYNLLMGAIEKNTTNPGTAAEIQEKTRRKLFFTYKKVDKNEHAFYLGCSLIADRKKVVTRHFGPAKTEIFILAKGVMENFINKNHTFFSIFFPVDSKDDTYNSSPLFAEDKFQVLSPIVYELLKETRVTQLKKINDDFEVRWTYGLRDYEDPLSPNNFVLRCYEDEHKITRYFSRNNTNPAFIDEIERFYNENKIFKDVLLFLQTQKENASNEGKQLLRKLERGDYFIWPAFIDENDILKFFFKESRKSFYTEIAGVDLPGTRDKIYLLQTQLKNLIDALNNTVKQIHATAGEFEVIEIGRDGQCGWNSIIWCIYKEKKGDENFLVHREDLIKTYVAIRDEESKKTKAHTRKLLFQPQSPIAADEPGDEYNWQTNPNTKFYPRKKVDFGVRGEAKITWDDHTDYLRPKPEGEPKTHLYASGEDVQNVLACLGVQSTVSDGGVEYRNPIYIQEDDNVFNMVTWTHSHNAEYDWTFKIINTGAHWEVMEKKDPERVDKTRAYLQRAFELLVEDHRGYDRGVKTTDGKYITESKMVV